MFVHISSSVYLFCVSRCTLKGLPRSYNKDLQEDKEALFDSLDTVHSCLKVPAE